MTAASAKARHPAKPQPPQFVAEFPAKEPDHEIVERDRAYSGQSGGKFARTGAEDYEQHGHEDDEGNPVAHEDGLVPHRGPEFEGDLVAHAISTPG